MSEAFRDENNVIRKVTLSDGSEWTGTARLSSDKMTLWITLNEGATLTEVFSAFSNPKNTLRIISLVDIVFSAHSTRREYLNYTRLTDIKIQGDDILVRLQHPLPEESV